MGEIVTLLDAEHEAVNVAGPAGQPKPLDVKATFCSVTLSVRVVCVDARHGDGTAHDDRAAQAEHGAFHAPATMSARIGVRRRPLFDTVRPQGPLVVTVQEPEIPLDVVVLWPNRTPDGPVAKADAVVGRCPRRWSSWCT